MEREIRHLLNEFGSADLVADELISRWRKELLSVEQQRAVAQFLLDGGLQKKLLNEIIERIEKNQTVPWAQFAEALLRARIKLTPERVTAFIEGLDQHESWNEVLRNPRVNWSARFEEKRAQLQAQRVLEIAEKKTALKERVQFFRTNRMYDEEAAAIEQLRALFPDDTEFQVVERDHAERWARDIIASRSTARTDLTSELIERSRQLTPEQKSIKDLIVRQCLEIAAKRPEFAYDLALLLVFMEFYIEALEVLDLSPPAVKTDWLRLELLLKARQYVTVLDEANRLEIAYAGEPESTFAVIYARARALWGLGQSVMAIDLMRSIVNVRPHYKSAMSLLADWNGDDT